MTHNELFNHTKKLKLLYVEDDEKVRGYTLDLFKEFFGEITTAVDGQDAFDKFQEVYDTTQHFDIIISDINIPRMHGIEFVKAVKYIDKEIPVLFISAYNECSLFIDSINVGIEDYLLKPIDLDQLIRSLTKVVEKMLLKQEAKNTLHLLQQYQEITDHGTIVSKTNTKGIITYANDEFCKISEYSREELLGKNHNIIRHPDNPKSIYTEMWHTIKDKKKIWTGLVRNMSKNGKSYYVKTTIKPILDIDGNIVEHIALRDDITDIMSPQKQLEDLIETTKEPLLILIEIVDFSNLEKFYGTKLTSEIINEFAQSLINQKIDDCEFDKVFILENGRFAFAKDINDCILSIEWIVIHLQTLLHNLNNNQFNVNSTTYDITARISISYQGNVLENAKAGLDKLKKNKQDFILANNLADEEYELAQKNIKTLNLVKDALKSDNIISYFQPIINNTTQEIVKYESLVRLQDKHGNILTPYHFLETAKNGKFYSQITLIVLKNSFEILKKTDKSISINLSAIDIEKKNINEVIFQLLEENKTKASQIVFELLEDETIQDMNVIKKFIQEVKKYGVKIAIDDFGSGYSNFERLLDYQPDIIKIDGTLIKDILTNHYSMSIVSSIVAFAKNLNIQLIAEFVESKEIYETLKALGIDYSQGYYFGQPKPYEG